MIGTSQRKREEANKMREGLLKSEADLGKHRESPIHIIFSK